MNRMKVWAFVGALVLLLALPALQAAAFGSKEKEAALQTQLDDCSVQLAASDMLLAEKDKEIAALQAQLADMQAQLDDLGTRVGISDMLIAEREKSLLTVEAQAAAVEGDLKPFADKDKNLAPVLEKVKGIRAYIAGLELIPM